MKIGISKYRTVFGLFFLLSLVACGGDKDAALDSAYKKKQDSGNIIDILQNEDQFSTLLTALQVTDLDDVLNNDNAIYTLFAPTNSAFEALGADTVNALLKNEEALANILLYHVIAGSEINAYQALKAAGTTQKSANDTLLSITRSEERLFINGITIVSSDKKASNGVVHAIDNVIIPPDINNRTVSDVKADILTLAESYKGLDDPNYALHLTFEPLLAELLTLAPQVPIQERISLVSKPWKQVWGPYDYDSGQQGVNPDISPDEIYQVVNKQGYYYNVTPLINAETGNEQIGMLRGEFVFDKSNNQCLKVQFIKFPGLPDRPYGYDLWQLPALQEANTIEQITGLQTIEIVPSWIVRSFFGGGQLCEIYTDDTIRISISTEDDNVYTRKLYIMTAIK